VSVARALQVFAIAIVAFNLAAPSTAAATLDGVKARGTVRCGVSEGLPGLSQRDAGGRWRGIDVDFCRAVAAAVLGDADKATLVPLRAAERFPALRLGKIDVLLRNTTWTLSREAGLGVLFAGVLLHDWQGLMVAADAQIESANQLAGTTICVEKGTLHGVQLSDWAQLRQISITPLVLDSGPEAASAFFAGRCAALSSDLTALAAIRATAPDGHTPKILTEQISKQPLGPAVRADDDNWFTLVRWVLFALVAADEAGLTQSSVATLRGSSDPVQRRVLEADRELGRLLDIAPEWSLRAVMSVGNYSEMFERNLGRQSPLRLEPGVNRPWNRGGILYAPPLQ
jgi:general L-amino acid transport system substrate-binding protein